MTLLSIKVFYLLCKESEELQKNMKMFPQFNFVLVYPCRADDSPSLFVYIQATSTTKGATTKWLDVASNVLHHYQLLCTAAAAEVPIPGYQSGVISDPVNGIFQVNVTNDPASALFTSTINMTA